MLGESPHRSSSHIAEYRRLKCARRSGCRATHYAPYGGGNCPLPAPARAVPDCVEYHSACSMMSATAASLRTRRFFFTAYGRARRERESSPRGVFRLPEVQFSAPGRQRRVPVRDCLGGAPCLAESVRGHTRSAFPIARSDLPFDVLFERFGERDVQ
jgi:hypothetical protein